MSYSIEFSEDALSKLESLSKTDAKLLRQVFIKALSLRRNPKPQDCKQLISFKLSGLQGLRVDQGEYRIIYAVNEDMHKVIIGQILHRGQDYKDLKG